MCQEGRGGGGGGGGEAMQTQEVVIMAFYFVMSVMSSGHGVVARRSFIEGVLEESRIDSDMFETCRAKGECFR